RHGEAGELAARSVLEEALQLPGGHVMAGVVRIGDPEGLVGGAVQHRGEGMPHRRTDHGEATHAHPFDASPACHSLTFSACSARFAANFVSPVSVLTLTR